MRTLAFVVLLSGCAISTETYLPDGSKGYSISCDGTANSMATCFQKAGQLCGEKGYTIVNREGQAVPMGTSVGTADPYSAGYISQYGMVVTRSLFIRCG